MSIKNQRKPPSPPAPENSEANGYCFESATAIGAKLSLKLLIIILKIENPDLQSVLF